MKVLWLTFIPSPYRIAFFEELGKQCDLTILFERASSKTRKGTWDEFDFKGYTGEILKGITIGGYDRFCPSVKKYLKDKSYDVVVVSNPTSPTGIYAARFLKKKKIPYIVESDGAIPTGKKGLRLRLKKYVMGSAKLCLSTAQLHDEYYHECGVEPQNVKRYPFTSLFKKDILTAPLSIEEKIVLKQELGIKEEKILLTVGRFIYGKGFDVLLNAVKELPKNIGIYFVGGEPTEEYIKLCEDNNLSNAHFLGFKTPNELKSYYQAADFFVLPTRSDVWGLVINEAMAQGLPVVTTDKCVAGLELVKNGKNGYIVPVDNIEALTNAVSELISCSEEEYKSMSEYSLQLIKGYTFENMAKVHMGIFEEYIKDNKA